MKKVFALLCIIAVFAVSLLSSCTNCEKGSGKMITDNRPVKPFSQLDISGQFKVTLKQDTGYSLKIIADDNLMQKIQSDVSGDKLTIHTKNNSCNVGQFTVYLSMKDISSIRTSGAVDLTSAGKINTKDIDIDLSGATKLNLDINANNVTTHSSGSTEIMLTGQASSHTVSLSGMGDLNALDFVVAKYRVESSGISHCKINVLNDLTINSSGASDIEYRGNPGNISNNKSGASTLKKIN